MGRQDNIAIIDAALAGVQAPAAEDTTALTPQIAPGVETPAPDKPTMTADEKRAFDASRQAAMDRKQLLEEAMARDQAERDAFDESANATVAGLTKIVRGTSVRLAGIPSPGGIVLPLVILLVFFFLLIPVNGHTRFVWIWLVISGNASINQGSGATADQKGTGTAGPASPPDTIGGGSTGTAGPPVQPPGGGTIAPQPPPSFPFLPLLSFTGVEDLTQ